MNTGGRGTGGLWTNFLMSDWFSHLLTLGDWAHESYGPLQHQHAVDICVRRLPTLGCRGTQI